MPAPIKNKNAQKPPDDKLMTHLHIRCSHAEKEKWKAQAAKKDLKLADFVRKRLNDD